MSIAERVPEYGDTVETQVGGSKATAMVLSVSPDGNTIRANVFGSGNSYDQRTLTRSAGIPGHGQWNWRQSQPTGLASGWGPPAPQPSYPPLRGPGIRGVELFDQVILCDLDGKQSSVMVTGLSQPGNPCSPVLVGAHPGLKWDYCRSVPFSATPCPGHWSWPASQAPGNHPQASGTPAVALNGARIPRKGDRIRVIDGGQLLGATIGFCFHDSSPTSEVFAAVDGRFGQPEKRFHHSAQPAEGRWSW